jgi:tRNA/tmRNA/rRNA uracil-C5-methylase (TrmA/RlmC/RlmD family)
VLFCGARLFPQAQWVLRVDAVHEQQAAVLVGDLVDLTHPVVDHRFGGVVPGLLLDNAGAVVFDPFCGSGTTLVAAARCNRSYIGIEMDADYHKIAVERVGAENSQGKFF